MLDYHILHTAVEFNLILQGWDSFLSILLTDMQPYAWYIVGTQ